MSKHRDFDHLDILYASWTDAIQEFIGTAVEGLRLSTPTSTSVRATAATDSGQVSIGINGKWRYRSTSHDVTVSGSAGIKDIHAVAVTDNDFVGAGSDPDETDYNFELRSVTTATTPGSVVAYRKIAEVDWDGTKITGLRQMVGADDVTLPSYPIAPRVDASALIAKGVSSQVEDIAQVQKSDGTKILRAKADGTIGLPSVDIDGGTIDGITDLAVVDGGTGASTASGARTNLSAQAQDSDLDAIALLATTAYGRSFLTLADAAAAKTLITLPTTVVSSLPGAPTDGQDIYYQSAAMATDGIVWHLRYRSGASGSYKWEPLGVPPLYSQSNGADTTNTGVIRDVASGPTWNLPLAGDYLVEYGSPIVFATGATYAQGSLSIEVGTLNHITGDASITSGPPLTEIEWDGDESVGGSIQSAQAAYLFTGCLAAATVKLRFFRWQGPSSVQITDPWFKITPRRLG